MSQKLSVAVTGLAATYPYGGVFWDYLQYVLGLFRLGHDVLYLEDTGKWCYDPLADTFVEDGTENAAVLARHIKALDPGLTDRWFYRDATGNTFGQSPSRVAEFCRHADLFIHLSASCLMRDEYLLADRVAFIDSDPMYTQASILAHESAEDGESKIKWWQDHHDVFFTFGENIGQPDCIVPLGPFKWMPTRQPIVMECFAGNISPVSQRKRVLTTVASWKPHEDGPVVDGVSYYGKSKEFEKFIQLPSRSPLPLELAMSGPAPIEKLKHNGWMLRSGLEVSATPWVYRDYLAKSFAEWSIAKNAYVASRSGWFSCRSACYLALGVPVVVQKTGFEKIIPTGAGILAFETLEQAASAIDDINTRPEYHAKAAIELTREYFAHDRVLPALLEAALSHSE